MRKTLREWKACLQPWEIEALQDNGYFASQQEISANEVFDAIPVRSKKLYL